MVDTVYKNIINSLIFIIMISEDVRKRVVEQEIGVKSMEDYMAEKLMEIERNKLDLYKADVLIRAYKQLNVRHKNIIDVQRVALKEVQLEAEIDKTKNN